jgi:hypothetical protein
LTSSTIPRLIQNEGETILILPYPTVYSEKESLNSDG